MMNVFVDTCVFESENFFQTDRIKTLFSLAKDGKIKIIITQINYEEMKKHLLERVDETYVSHKKLKNDRGMQILKDIDKRYLLKNFCVEEIKKLFIDQLDKVLKEINCIIVPYSNINIESVFNKFFDNQFPFGKGGKKHEFPDAFALELLEKWCLLNKERCTILSCDTDLINYKSKYLDVVKDYKVFLEDQIINTESHAKTKEEIHRILQDLILSRHKELIINKLYQWGKEHIHHTWHAKYIDGIDIFTPEIEIKEFYITSIIPNGYNVEIISSIDYRLRIQDNYGALDINDYRFTNSCFLVPLNAKIIEDELKIMEINNGNEIQIVVD